MKNAETNSAPVELLDLDSSSDSLPSALDRALATISSDPDILDRPFIEVLAEDVERQKIADLEAAGLPRTFSDDVNGP